MTNLIATVNPMYSLDHMFDTAMPTYEVASDFRCVNSIPISNLTQFDCLLVIIYAYIENNLFLFVQTRQLLNRKVIRPPNY